jgi:hypothetical protein
MEFLMNLTRIGAWVLFAGVLGSCWGCYPSDIPAGVPSCVREAIQDESSSDGDYSFLISVQRYDFLGETVYLLERGHGLFEFFPSEVYDEDCRLRCLVEPIVGNRTCQGVDFFELAIPQELSWHYED